MNDNERFEIIVQGTDTKAFVALFQSFSNERYFSYKPLYINVVNDMNEKCLLFFYYYFFT